MGLECALEESVEDAFVALFKATLPGEIKSYPAFTETLQYPCTVIHAGDSDNWNNEAIFNWRRKLQVNIGIAVECAPAKDSAGVVVQTARERNRAMRAAVIGIIARDKLHENLNACSIPGILFSMAYLMPQMRSVRSDGRILESILTVEVIAQPKAI